MPSPACWPVRAGVSVALALLAGCSPGRDAAERRGFTELARAAAPAAAAVDPDQALVLPADFPPDVYLPAEYAVGRVLDVDGVRVVSLTTGGRVPALFADAREAMLAHGWRQTLSMQHSGDDAMATYEKDARATVLSFTAHPGGSVALSVQLRSDRD